jgi:hypothetical protein
MLLFTPPAAPERESSSSACLWETATGNPNLTLPRLNQGLVSCVLFVLLPLAVASFLLLNAVWGPLFDDPRPHVPDPPALACLVAWLLVLVTPCLPFLGVGAALLGVCQRWRKPWAALLGLCLNGSIVLWLLTGWPVRL